MSLRGGRRARRARAVIRTGGDLQAGPHREVLAAGGAAELSQRIEERR
jgi:hypothetical protein